MDEPDVWIIEISMYANDVALPQDVFNAVNDLIAERFPGFSGVIGMHKDEDSHAT